MPKIVDHDRRRREIIEATWSVIARRGIAGTTFRAISGETGYSTGALAHYFGDKDDLLIQSLEVAHREIRRLYDEATTGRAPTGIDALREYMLACLPLDDHRALLAAVEVAFWGEAIGSDRLIAINAAETDGFLARIGGMLDEARQLAEIPSGTDVAAAAKELRVLMDGLSVQSVVYPRAPDAAEQERMLDSILERLRRSGDV